MLALRKLLFKNFNLKLVACIIGYGLWHIASQSLIIEHTFAVPIAFYNIDKKTIKGPESVNVTLRGKRATLRNVARHLALHIDASTITADRSTIAVTKEDLFLPDTVSLVHYTPTDSLIHIAC
jgi:hypothetical protein